MDSGGRQVKNEEMLQSETPKIFGERSKILQRVLFWSKRHSQQTQIFSVGIMEKVFIEKLNKDQKINK